MKHYYIMHKDFAEPLLAMHSKAARYDNKTLVLTGDMPKDFKGEIVPICDMELTNEQLLTLVDNLRAETSHTGKLVKVKREGQGDYILANHPAFKQDETET